jgi:hypothetical protein
MKRQRLALIAFPLAVQVPFSILIARYSYPDILLRGAGEHVGQLFMGVWTALASALLLRALGSRLLAVAGFLASALFLVGLGAGLSRAVPLPAALQQVPMVAFIAWSLWSIAAGVTLLRCRA